MDLTNTLKKICEQDAFIVLHPESKQPTRKGWTNNGLPLDQALHQPGNLGLLLGSLSGVLDVDLDCAEAKAIADIILPKPIAIFDRGTNDSGHYLYRASDCGPRKSFTKGGNASTLVELRGDGTQTMIPPSVHPNGQQLGFTHFAEDAQDISHATLARSASLLAAASEIAQCWTSGHRHDLALAFTGLCLKHGVEADLVEKIVERICEIASDDEKGDRIACVQTAREKQPEQLIGFQGLIKCIGRDAAQRVSDRVIAYVDVASTTVPETISPQQVDILNFAQFANSSQATEANLAEVFGQWLEQRAVYAVEAKQWMIWNGHHWEADAAGQILKLAVAFIREAKDALTQSGQHEAARKLSSFESLNRLENLSRLAATDRAVSVAAFDNDDLLLATGTQWIDLRGPKAFDPDPSLLVSKSLAVHFDPEATCPAFEGFLMDVFEANTDLIAYLQRAIGYSLTGRTDEQCMFILIGDGANGKSTFTNVVNRLLGDYAKAAASQTLIARGGNSVGDDLVDLVGARLISVSETEEGEALAEAKIKQMTGGDTLKGRPLYGKFIEFQIQGKIFLATNSLPAINNTDHGIWRRIQAIPFNRTFKAEEQDRDLGRKLMAELPGILNWAVKGCMEWQKQGLNPPK
ncbi:phage/plasmid primase, P4 family, partial [Tritonibacter multivorans]